MGLPVQTLELIPVLLHMSLVLILFFNFFLDVIFKNYSNTWGEKLFDHPF